MENTWKCIHIYYDSMYCIVDLGTFFNIFGRERAYAGRGRLFTPHKVTTGYCLELYYWLHGSSHLVTKYRGEDYVEETMAVSRQVRREHVCMYTPVQK